jgi:tripartite-type tricarboxylate transporter receptor subunit TctC
MPGGSIQPKRRPVIIDDTMIAAQPAVSSRPLTILPASIEHIRAGRLRALAATTATRLDALPDIPTVAEFLPGYEASAVHGIGAPKNTPTEIVDRLNKEINVALADPKMAARLADLGLTVLSGSPADFGKLIADETEKWAKVVKFSGAKPN